MDDLLQVFVETYYTDEYQTEVYRSFHLFDFYEYADGFSPLIDIAMSTGSVSSDESTDKFTLKLNEGLDYILEQHSIKLVEEATIFEKNELLYALAYIQNLEDYSAIIAILESLESDEEQLAIILSDLCQLEQIKIMSIVENFNPNILKDLKLFIYGKEKEAIQVSDLDTKIVNNFKLFTQIAGQDTLGYQLVETGIVVGVKFETYLPYVSDLIKQGSPKQIAASILSIIYLSQDGFNNPLLLFRKHSFTLLEDLNLVSNVEVEVIKLVAQLEELKGLQNEKDRISQDSNTK